jgi:hypothetical protein
MSLTFAFWAEAGMTVPNTAGATITDGLGPTDRIVYFGSPASGKTLQAASAPGTDPVQISIADANGGTGIDATALKLALTAGGLESAVAGAPLSIGTSISSGSSIAIYVRTSQGALGVGSYADLSLTTNPCVEA